MRTRFRGKMTSSSTSRKGIGKYADSFITPSSFLLPPKHLPFSSCSLFTLPFHSFPPRRKIADVLQEIQQYQNSPYCLTQEPTIQEWILSQDPVGSMMPNQWEDDIFERSRSIEPKDLPYKKVVCNEYY